MANAWDLALVSLLAASSVSTAVAADTARPDVVLVTVDTLRPDRLSGYGYERPTSPNMDRVIASGLRFVEARTVEPLTSPASCSMITGLYPHEHGSSRNGLRMRRELSSLPKRLSAGGYRTAGFVGNWTLRNKLSGLGEHFDHFEGVLTKKRWWGLLLGEAEAEDLTSAALAWVDDHRKRYGDQPFLLWVHYTEPHAPYVLHDEYVERLGLSRSKRKMPPGDRYDTEIAFVDAAIGQLLAGLENTGPAEQRLVVLASDHGESLGEHKYWGHGRHLYEPTLRIPLAIAWPGRIEAREVSAPALILDIAPTVLGLLDLAPDPEFRGFDWSAVLDGGKEPFDRVTQYQAHRGAVLTNHDSDLARRAGLLEVARLEGHRKEIVRVKSDRRFAFDLAGDPGETATLVKVREAPSEALQAWMNAVTAALGELDSDVPEPLDNETVERLRALGYAD